MYKIATVLLALALAGCATTPYGNFTNNPIAYDQKIARDAVKQLVLLYPPAKTRLELKQPSADAFGAALVNGLRAQGYALLEFNQKETKAKDTVSDGQMIAVGQPASTDTSDLPLRYVLDQAIGSNFYRLHILVGTQSISRPYIVQDGTVVPSGFWMRRE